MKKSEYSMAEKSKQTDQKRSIVSDLFPGEAGADVALATAGREYAKEFMRWAGRWLGRGGKQLRILFIRLATRIPERGYNGVNTAELNRRMRKINWNKDYYSAEAIARSERSPRRQRTIMRVNSILRDLKKLSDSGHYMGEELRWKLQYKHWTNTRMQPQIRNTLETTVPPAGYQTPVNRAAPGNSQRRESNVNKNMARDIRPDLAQRQQQNAARRKQIAKAGANLLTSVVSRQHKRKKGLGI